MELIETKYYYETNNKEMTKLIKTKTDFKIELKLNFTTIISTNKPIPKKEVNT